VSGPLTLELPTKTEITDDQYELVRKLVYETSGINLGTNKQYLVQARLAKRIRELEFPDFDRYFRYLKENKTGEEIGHLVDVISTNTTQFFREPDHFQFLRSSIEQQIRQEQWDRRRHTIRIWSAACSTGEEPYSLAMELHQLLEKYPAINAKILATDISQTALAQARLGRYQRDKLNSVPPQLRQKYFRPVSPSRAPGMEVVPQIRNMITFVHFNLMTATYPFKYGFDYVFCRNVMIYFNRQTQQEVVHKISQHLRPQGYLIVGHAESLHGIEPSLHYVQPTIYQKRSGFDNGS